MCSFSFLCFLDTCLLTPPCRRRVLVLLQKLSLISTTFLEGVKDKNSRHFLSLPSQKHVLFLSGQLLRCLLTPFLIYVTAQGRWVYSSSQAPNSSSTNFSSLHSWHCLSVVHTHCCSKSSFFVQKFNFNFPRKLSIFLG